MMAVMREKGEVMAERTELKTSRGTVFPIRAETEHYVLCGEPKGSKDTMREAILDFEDLYGQGFRVCNIMGGIMGGAGVIFEKIKPAGGD